VTFALVLVSAFLHALWNALLRLEKDKDRALVCAVAVASGFALVVASIRFGVTGVPPFATVASLLWSLLAGFLEWLYFIALARALAIGPLGTVYTISRGGAVIAIWPASVALLGEPLTLLGAIGSGIVCLGLAATSHTGGDNRTGQRSAIAWAAACAVAIAGYHLAYKVGLRAGASPSASFGVSLAFASCINFARLGGVPREVLRARLARILIMGLVCGGSFLLLIEALAGDGAGTVLTLRNTSVLFAIGFAAIIGERPRALQIGGAVLVTAGAVLIAWP
jgi:drug/metabolite transporter (DMT)-like permease